MNHCWRRILVALTALVAAGPAAQGSSPAPMASPVRGPCLLALPVGASLLALDVGGTTREVRLHVPRVAARGPLPAVIAFHGYTAFAQQLEATSGLHGAGDGTGVIVALPQALGSPTDWSFASHPGPGADDLAMVDALIDRLVGSGCADPDAIVLAGHSMGGGMASDAACRLADRVAAAVLVAATWFAEPCVPTRSVAIDVIHALDDPLLPYEGGPIGGRAGWDEVLAVEAAAGAWAARDGCDPGPTTVRSPDAVDRLEWHGCRAAVTLLRLSSGGHDWPSVATERIIAVATALGGEAQSAVDASPPP